MNFLMHALVNAIIAVSSHYLFGLDWVMVLVFISAGILIDLDHIFFLVFKHRTLDPKKLISAGGDMRKRMQPGLYIFHSPEFNALLLALSFFNPIFLVIFISDMIHISMDIIEHYRHHRHLSWIKEWSIIHSL